jgi:asparagine synthase (glutamine-hydrolysing)
MCGICGIVQADKDRPIDSNQLTSMRDQLERRGPDDAGAYIGKGIGLGSRRLSILDLSRNGHMPMSTEDSRYWITYNGEVYNYLDLRKQLISLGHRFVSNTDTEVLLKLYVEFGPQMLSKLNGMFAFAIWDDKERILFIARDRMGIKPISYVVKNRDLYFASEEKALFSAGIDRSFEYKTFQELICFRYVAGESTPYEGVKRLLPGHYLVWKDGSYKIHRWWSLSQRVEQLRTTSVSNPLELYEETFANSVKHRLLSDVPVGVLLSGGLDSGSIAASASAQSENQIKGFTVSFNEKIYDESHLAKSVADKFGIAWHHYQLPANEILPRLFHATWINDAPLAHGNDLHLWSISQYAKKYVSVLLSGEGADETLGGYIRYQPLKFHVAMKSLMPLKSLFKLAGPYNRRLQKLLRFIELGSIEKFVLYNSCDVLPTDLEQLGFSIQDDNLFRKQILTEALRLYPEEPMRQAMFYDQHTFLSSVLDRNDRMTMGASIECRVPFLDFRLVELVGSLPSSVLLACNRTKPLLRKTVARNLPNEILNHKKWGFSVPWHTYIGKSRELRQYLLELPSLEPYSSGIVDRKRLTKLIDGFLQGNHSLFPLTLQLMMVAIWYSSCIENHTGSAINSVNPVKEDESLTPQPTAVY